MTIHVSCPHCKAPIKARDDKADTRARCPKCHTVIMVPRWSSHPLQPSAESPAGETGVAPPRTASAAGSAPIPPLPPPLPEAPPIVGPLRREPVAVPAPAPTLTPVSAVQVNIQQADPSLLLHLNKKSVGVAIVLAFFFGPLGMIYSTWVGALVIFLVNLILVFPTFGTIVIITWPAGMVWAGIAAQMHNDELLRLAMIARPSAPSTTSTWR